MKDEEDRHRRFNSLQAKGRGKTIPKRIHAELGTEIYTPEFSDSYVVLLVLPDTKMDEVST